MKEIVCFKAVPEVAQGTSSYFSLSENTSLHILPGLILKNSVFCPQSALCALYGS